MKNKFLSSIAALAVTIMISHSADAKIWRVNNNPNYRIGCNPPPSGHCFNQLSDAINAPEVSAGDTIHLEASVTPYAATTITKKVIIIGPGCFLNENTGLQKNAYTAQVNRIIFATGSDGSKISGIYVGQGGNSSSIQINSANNIYIERVQTLYDITFVAGTTNTYIYISKSYIGGSIYTGTNNHTTTNLHISNCYLDDFSSSTSNTGTLTHCVLNNDINVGNGFTVSNNIIRGGTVTQNNNSTANIYSNLFIASSLPAWLSGATPCPNRIVSSGVFVSSGTTDGILKVNPACSQCSLAYSGGNPDSCNAQFGMFGGADRYILSGIPDVPTIYQLQSPSTVQQGGTINVTIGTRSNN